MIIIMAVFLSLSGCALNHSSNYGADGKIKKRVLLDAAKSIPSFNIPTGTYY